MDILQGKRDYLPHLYITGEGKLVDNRINGYFVIGMVEVDKEKGYGGGKEVLLLVEVEPYVS
jgi:hypothetical protein